MPVQRLPQEHLSARRRHASRRHVESGDLRTVAFWLRRRHPCTTRPHEGVTWGVIDGVIEGVTEGVIGGVAEGVVPRSFPRVLVDTDGFQPT